MRVLLVNLPDCLAGPVAARLAHRHRVERWSGRTVDGAPTVLQRPEVVIHEVAEGSDATARLDAATLGTWNVMTGLRPDRYLQLTSMSIFARYHRSWDVTEEWMPRPSAWSDQLALHLAELTSKEISRELPIATQVLRMDPLTAGAPGGAEWLHVDDAADAIADAAEVDLAARSWRALHVVRGTGKYPLGALAEAPYHFRPKDPGGPWVPSAPPADEHSGSLCPDSVAALPRADRVTILGGGPLGAATVVELRNDHQLRVVDYATETALREGPPQSPHAPRLAPIEAPHQFRTGDITNLGATLEVATGTECLVNCAVARADPERAFRVNVLGAYHTMRVAQELGLRRVVHTGPVLGLPAHPVGTREDEDVAADAPPRSGANVYFLTKLLARELTRILARELQIAAPILQFCAFVDPNRPPLGRLHPFAVSWRDAGRAIGAAVKTTTLPDWSPVVNVFAPGPHHRFRTGSAWRVLGWSPEDELTAHWRRSPHRPPIGSNSVHQ